MEFHQPFGRPLALVSALAIGAVLIAAGCAEAPSVNPAPSISPTAPPLAPSTVPSAAGPTPNSAQSGATTKPAVVPALCNSATLSISLGPNQGAAGTVFAPLRFTNKGPRPCLIQGFPGVSYVTGDRGEQVGQAARRDGAPGGPVTLQPGGVASATLAMVQVANYDRSVCRPTPVRGLRVYPPSDIASVFVPLPQGSTGCAGNPPGPQLRISSVTAGPGQG